MLSKRKYLSIAVVSFMLAGSMGLMVAPASAIDYLPGVSL